MNQQDEIKELQAQSYGYVVFGEDRFKEMEPRQCLTDEHICINNENNWILNCGRPRGWFEPNTIYRRLIVLPNDPDWVLVPESIEEFVKWTPDMECMVHYPIFEPYSPHRNHAILAIRRRRSKGVFDNVIGIPDQRELDEKAFTQFLVDSGRSFAGANNCKEKEAWKAALAYRDAKGTK
jgi:hypothetical protein